MKSKLGLFLLAGFCVIAASACGKKSNGVPATNLFAADGSSGDPTLGQNYISRCGTVGGRVISLQVNGSPVTVCQFRFLASNGSKNQQWAYKISPTTTNFDRAIRTGVRLYPGDQLLSQAQGYWGSSNNCDTDMDGYVRGRQGTHNGFPTGFSAKTDRGDFMFLGGGYNYPNNVQAITNGGVLYLGMNIATRENGYAGCSNFYYQVSVVRCVDNNGATYRCSI